MIPRRRPSILVSVVTALGLMIIGVTGVWAPPASADTGCPTRAANYASGGGTAINPWIITTKEQLQRLREVSGDWSASFRLGASIDMGGCTWTNGIGTMPAFQGTFDGDGHTITGLTIDSTNASSAGLFGSLAGYGVISDLGFTGSVRVVASGVGSATTKAGGLVGSVGSNATVSGSWASGDVSATLTVTEQCFTFCNSIADVMAGGLVGYSDGTIANSYATGDVSATASATGTTSMARRYVGGLAGQNYGYGARTITNSYATGELSGSASGTSTTNAVGGFVGDATVAMADTFWDTSTSGTTTGVAVGTDAVKATVTGRTSAQMQTASTFANWSITDGYSPSTIWGICPAANGGRPFLSTFHSTTPCISAPTITALAPTTGPTTGGTSIVVSGASLGTTSAVTIGGTSASFTVDSDTQLTVTAPAGSAGAADIAITNTGGTTTSNGAYTYTRVAQTVTWSPTTALLTTSSPATPSVLASALGGATITYAVQATTNACTVDSSTGVLTFATAGWCLVRATAAQTSTYEDGYRDATFTVTAPPPSGGGSGGGGTGGSSSSSTSTTSSPSRAPSATTPTVPSQTVSIAAEAAGPQRLRAATPTRILFALSSSRLDLTARARLDALIAATRGRASSPVTVTVGVVRAVGAREADRRLARERATRVADYLRTHGMPGTITVGSSVPSRLTTPEARRVDVIVSDARA